MLISPSGKLAHVSSHPNKLATSLVTPIRLASGTPLKPIRIRGHAEHFVLARAARPAA